MTNKELIKQLKQIFDNFNSNQFIYIKPTNNHEELELIQKSNLQVKSLIINYLPINITPYIAITPKRVLNIINKLNSLYNYTFNNKLYIELKLIQNGFTYKVIDRLDKNKIINKGKLLLKSKLSLFYYICYLLSKS